MPENLYEMARTYLIPLLLALPVLALLFLFDAKIDVGKAGSGRGRQRQAARHSVLVVDDSGVSRAKLRRLLEGSGYSVATAEDGAQALAELGRASFSLVITDLEMPNMDGFELIASIQGGLSTEGTPIIAITGHDDLQARVSDCQGLFGIFKKPWNDRELLRRVDALCGVKAGSGVHGPSDAGVQG